MSYYREDFKVNDFFVDYMLSINNPNSIYTYSYTGKCIKVIYNDDDNSNIASSNELIFKDLISFRNTLILKLIDSINKFTNQEETLTNKFKIFEAELEHNKSYISMPRRFKFRIDDLLDYMYSDFFLSNSSFTIFGYNIQYYKAYRLLYIELQDIGDCLIVYNSKTNSYYSVKFAFDLLIHKCSSITDILLDIFERYYTLGYNRILSYKFTDLMNEYIIKDDNLCNIEELQKRLTEYNFICRFSDNNSNNEMALKEIIL